jgi:hypothetical protein
MTNSSIKEERKETCAIFEHYVVTGRYSVVSMENEKCNLPDKFWKFLGLVKLSDGNPLYEKIHTADGPVEVSVEMFGAVPSLNKIVQSL